jgi:hypothetical protein
MILLLLLFQGFKTVLAPSLLFPFDYPSSQYFPQVYNVSLSHAWNVKEEFAAGVYGEIFVRNSDRYSDPYLQNPDLYLKLFTYGVGGCFDYKINDYFAVGAGLGVYRLGFKYPYAKEGGEVDYWNETRTNLGFYSSFSVSKPIDRWRLGASIKIYLIGRQYYDYYVYYYQEGYPPDFPSSLQGIAIGLNLGYER